MMPEEHAGCDDVCEREQRGDAEIDAQPVHDHDALTFSLAARRSVSLMRVCQPGILQAQTGSMRICSARRTCSSLNFASAGLTIFSSTASIRRSTVE